MAREGGAHAACRAGSAERAAVLKPEVLDLGRQANANSPVLHNFDRSG
ncbi:hypothetical protein LP420_00565 [Massilia sp. B-10]|nr:hypothetical protein LP420_00565 [Massilia sp. B-10]